MPQNLCGPFHFSLLIMAKYRLVLDFETDDNITLGMITHGLEYNENDIRNAMFSEQSGIVGDCALSYEIVEARRLDASAKSQHTDGK